MEADFSGYATKNKLKCSDGRTIMPGAFKHTDKKRVPLVWQHQHNAPENVLGHAILENREDGTYTYGYFNSTDAGQQAKSLVQHGDVNALSIYANNLRERNKEVFHGDIREVSIVLSGANPGAMIDFVALAHGDGTEVADDEAIIYTGLTLEHEDGPGEEPASSGDMTLQEVFETFTDDQKDVVYALLADALATAPEPELVAHSDDFEEGGVLTHAGLDVEAVLATLDETQTDTVMALIGDALDSTPDNIVSHETKEGEVMAVMKTLDKTQTDVVLSLIGKALKEKPTEEHSDIKHDNLGDTDMTRNVFEQNGAVKDRKTLTHDQLQTIVEDAKKTGSLKESFLAHAGDFGIDDIEILFPDARALSNTPDFIARRMEWVADVLTGTKHSPFSRIKSIVADITADEARARGYVKGTLKKEEVFKLLQRKTTPTTIYKKQKLDRDDMLDITDLDVVAFMKAEMRLMIDEELARAILLGDGRSFGDDDKIDEGSIRPIATDHDMYAHQVTLGSGTSVDDRIEAIIRARGQYKGSGQPTMFTTLPFLTDMILLKDKMGRRLYSSVESLASELMVKKIVTVEVMEQEQKIVAIIVNLSDYTIGADKGGQLNMFDDFDIDYNQYKYLMETRVSGALTKPKSAVVINRAVGTLVTPVSPDFDGASNTITVPSTTGVKYQVEGVDITGTETITSTTEVDAVPADGYDFPAGAVTNWTFVFTP